jgi:hypothetical protein
VIAYRVFPYDGDAGGALRVPRPWQGAGRHDNPDHYGCLYVSEVAVSSVAEALAVFRGAGALAPTMLVRSRLPLALAELELGASPQLIDLDDPAILMRERLRPSEVATAERAVTQAGVLALWERHPEAVGVRWWSTLEASWLNLTLFDRGVADVRLSGVSELRIGHPVVAEAAQWLGLR